MSAKAKSRLRGSRGGDGDKRRGGARTVALWRTLVVFLGVLLSVGFAYAFHEKTPASYQATARLLLVLPSDARREIGSPFMDLPKGLVVLSDVVAQYPKSDAVRAELAANGMERQFEVGLDPSVPIITLSVEGSDPDNVIRTRNWLVGQLTSELAAVQKSIGAPARQTATPIMFMADSVAHLISGDRSRAAAGIVAAGVLGTLLVTFSLGRRSAARGTANEPETLPPEATGILPAWGFVALYAALLLCIPTRLVVGPIGAPGSPANLLAIAGLLWWVCAMAGGQLRRWRFTPFRLAVGIFTALSLASYGAGQLRGWYQPADIRPRYGARLWRVADVAEMTEVAVSAADRGLLALAGWVGIALLTAEGIRSWKELNKVIAWVVGAGSVVAAMGVVQYFTGLNIAAMIHIPGLSAQGAFGEALSRSDLNRVVSTSTHPIELGVIMAAMLPLALHIGLRSRRILGWVPTGLIGLATLMTVSRSGVVVAAVAMLVLLIGWPMKRRAIAVGLLPIALLLGRLALPGLLGTIRSLFTNLEDDPSITGRTDDYGLVFRLIGEQPLFGKGLFTFVPMVYRTIDNQALVLLLELGILGTLAFLALIFVGFGQGLKVHRRARNADDAHAGLAIAAALAGIVTSYLTFDALSFRQVAGLTFLFLGLSGAAWNLTRRQDTETPEAAVALPTTSQRLKEVSA